uniref:Transmembrane protein 222 n=1 Tax=Oncorhynchus kisutch TaxID=8019 RepID=A0A8C7IGZ9_ONCKI
MQQMCVQYEQELSNGKWLLPFIGHMGICTSSGIIRDFAGPYFVSEDNMAFGRPTKYWMLDVAKVYASGSNAWDTAVHDASEEYKNRMHNLCCDNCHSHVAMALNLMRYENKTSWNMINLCLLSLVHGKHIRITEVESQTFSGLRSLRSLDLSSNQLAVINPEAFTVPGHTLRELNLSRALYNHSSLINLAMSLRWSTLVELRTLDLSGNRLIYLPSHTFSYLGGLRRLILANNSLVALYNGTFSGLDSLEQLDLTLNALRTVQEEGLAELASLPPGVRLLLGENPWTCICGMEPFAAWLNSSQGHVGDAEGLVCAFPSDMRNTSLLRLAAGQSGVGGDGVALGCHRVGEGADLALQTSYVFLGIVLGFVGLVFLLVLYLNRQGIKKRINDMREACTEVLEGYHYRYEHDADPRLSQVSTTADI